MTHKKIIIAFSIEKRIIDAEEQKKHSITPNGVWLYAYTDWKYMCQSSN